MRELTYREQSLAFQFCHVALPDDATDCDPWEEVDGTWRRSFTTQEWRIGDVFVGVAGEQNQDGDVSRWVYVMGEEHLDAFHRHELVQALLDAGTLLDSLG